MSYIFLSLWWHPQVENVEMIFDLIILMIFEFFMIHTEIFMAFIWRSWSWTDFLKGMLFFGAYAFAYNSAVSGNQILIIYSALVLNRMLSGILNRGKTNMKQGKDVSTIYLTIYFVLILVISMCSSFIPKLGLTNDFLKAANYYNMHFNGKWDSLEMMPHIAMCFGVFYYLTLTLVDMISIIRKLRVVNNDKDNTLGKMPNG